TSPGGLRPNPGPGGGDTDNVVDDQGFASFADLEAAANVGVSVSNDGGNTWRANPADAINTASADREWLAIDNGTSPSASDNTVFMTVRQSPVNLSQVYSS